MELTKAIERAVDKVLASSVEDGGLPLVHEPHEQFCQAVASGVSQLKSYQDCVAENPEMTRNNLAKKGSYLASLHETRIACLRARREAISIVTLDEVAEGFRQIKEIAFDQKKPDLRSANGALRSLGDIAGAFQRRDSGGSAPQVAINMVFSGADSPLQSVEVIDVGASKAQPTSAD